VGNLRLHSCAKAGGGGIRTRVRKYIPAGIYDAYLLLKFRFRRKEAANNRRKLAPESLAANVRDNASAASLLK
jgi:primosomal replication protein N